MYILPICILFLRVVLGSQKNWKEDTGISGIPSATPSPHKPAAVAAKSLQSRSNLCDPIDGSPPGSPIPGNLQARTLEWVAISFSNAWKWKNKVKSLSRVRLLATPWTAAHQAPPSMGFSRQEYWSGFPLPFPPHKPSFPYYQHHSPKWFSCYSWWTYINIS